MISIIFLSLAGAVLSAVIGTFWYSSMTPMGKIHMRYLGFDKLSEQEKIDKINEAKPKMVKLYIMQAILSLLTSFAVVYIVTMSIYNGLPLPMALGFVLMNWLCFMVPVYGSGIIWGNCDREIALKKFFSDILCSLVTVLLIGVLASLFV